MKKFLYEIFTADTDSTSYKKVTLNFLLASIAPIVLFFICNLIPIGNVFRFILLIPIFTFIWMLLMFFVRLIHVSDNKTLINIKRKGYKFKYKPIDLSIQDFEFWLKNAEVPETIYVKSKKGINYKFEISFEVKGKEPCWIRSNQIEAARIALTRYTKRTGKVWIKIFPDKPVTAKARKRDSASLT